MTREEAIKRLEWLRMVGNHVDSVTLDKEDMPYFDMAIAALREQPQWISVEERLPDEDGNYFCYCPVLQIGGKDIPRYEVYGFTLDAKSVCDLKYMGHTGVAWYWYDSEYGYCKTYSVTHWMPLPEPPEVEEV